MAFMTPRADYFTRAELVERDERGYKCAQCRARCIRYNIIGASDGFDPSCLKCCPPETGWYGSLSASGYMDRTEYHGPFATAAEAIKAVCDFYEVDEDGEDASA